MVKHRVRRQLRFNPNVYYFKPRGVPLKQLAEVVLKADEVEALKLHDVDQLDQQQAAAEMGISQPTFSRTLAKAYKKVAKALIKGQAIRLEQS
jgi:predicted DNA-binding protein (UPF0251 family)